MNAEATIHAGLNYVGALLNASRALNASCLFEAERRVVELVTISRRVLGPDHRITIQAVDLREISKIRNVVVLPDPTRFHLCDTRMMEKSVSSPALLRSQGE